MKYFYNQRCVDCRKHLSDLDQTITDTLKIAPRCSPCVNLAIDTEGYYGSTYVIPRTFLDGNEY